MDLLHPHDLFVVCVAIITSIDRHQQHPADLIHENSTVFDGIDVLPNIGCYNLSLIPGKASAVVTW